MKAEILRVKFEEQLTSPISRRDKEAAPACMSPSRFSVRATSTFERSARKLSGARRDFHEQYAAAILILQSNPYNRSRRYPIKKLEGVASGDDQYPSL